MIRTFTFIAAIIFAANLNAQSVAELYQQVEKSVVPIFTESEHTAGLGDRNMKVDDEGLGTGFIISSDGLIMTAAHVVRTSKRLTVQYDGKIYGAKILRNSTEADVALIQMEYPPANLPFVKLADSDAVVMGEEIFVVGFPFGLGKTLSTGNIGGRHIQKRHYSNINEIEMLQMDASTNPGNSGGPIFNMKGEVIGIVSSILTQGGGFDGIAFGATSNIAKQHLLVEDNIWLGLDAILLNGELARTLNIPNGGGILIQNVVPFSPAYQAGLKGGTLEISIFDQPLIIGGDIILKAGDISLADEQGIEKAKEQIAKKKSGEMVYFTILRDGATKVIEWRIKKDAVSVQE